MAHSIINSFVVNLVLKRPALLEARTLQYIPVNGKHYHPKFKPHRRLKYAFLPQLSKEAKMAPRGPHSAHVDFTVHSRYWQEPRTTASYSHGLIDGYDPLKDDKKTWLTSLNLYEAVQTRRKNKKAIRTIQSYDESYETSDFSDDCERIYKLANESVAEKNEDKMLDYLTPHAFKLAKENIKYKRIHWQFLKSIDPPKVLHIRTGSPSASGGNDEIFAQITVRLHTQQMLAVYDRFGRLMMGSEILAKDVLEIVVFERRMTHVYGKWRVHEKIPVPGGVARSELQTTGVYREILDEEVQQESVERVANEPAPTSAPTSAPAPEPAPAYAYAPTSAPAPTDVPAYANAPAYAYTPAYVYAPPLTSKLAPPLAPPAPNSEETKPEMPAKSQSEKR